MIEENTTSPFNEAIRQEAISEVANQHKGIEQDPMSFVKAVGRKFIEKQIERFPELCEVARVQNLIAFKNAEKYGKKGKYTDSYGWSDDGTFKFEYQIPQELYLFMQNLVNCNFWSSENRRTWTKFMKRICDGENAYEALHKAKMCFSEEASKVESVILGPDFRPISN